jgi:hypothetical protein
MTGGWFIGDFEPNVIKNDIFEVAVKNYQKGHYEPTHYHKISTEITVISQGRVRMCGVEYAKNDIIIIKPYEATDFLALEDVITTVVKYPSARDDKFMGEP